MSKAYECEKCGKEFNSLRDAENHEKICKSSKIKRQNSLKAEKTFKKVFYHGGHKLFPIHHKNSIGILEIYSDKIVFQEYGLLTSLFIEIPLSKILWKKVVQNTEEDQLYKNQMSGVSFLAGGPAITGFSRNITTFIIPYKDEKGILQYPKFSFSKKKEIGFFAEYIYDNI